ncbi:MAG: biotin--[acetyl-CoA-carboxylase] ligase [Anaerolineales bacterium]|nr:biotin--[acetyl-CoA-carboxylase] ligase [Anaerolineales bacterium]
MNLKSLHGLPLGEIRYFDSIGSTNSLALEWANQQAPNLSVVIADEQTAGRGRLERKWSTPKGTALAVSVILRPKKNAPLSRTVGLAALAITDSCSKLGLTPQIKWPNDVLLNGKKTAGILVEAVWNGANAESIVIGMGINLTPAALPPAAELNFPATSLESELGHAVNREEFLREVLANLIARLPRLETDSFFHDWEHLLAYKNQEVQIVTSQNEKTYGTLLGLEPDGNLLLQTEHGNRVTIHYGDVSLRPGA